MDSKLNDELEKELGSAAVSSNNASVKSWRSVKMSSFRCDSGHL